MEDTATTRLYTLSLHDALPILRIADRPPRPSARNAASAKCSPAHAGTIAKRRPRSIQPAPVSYAKRSEEHTSELQSRRDLVCRLLLEKKKRRLVAPSFPRLSRR